MWYRARIIKAYACCAVITRKETAIVYARIAKFGEEVHHLKIYKHWFSKIKMSKKKEFFEVFKH